MRRATDKRIVVVIDDEQTICDAAESLLKSAGLQVECFASAEDFLRSPRLRDSDCLVLGIGLPGMTGLQLQEHLLQQNIIVPIVFITADTDSRRRKQALRAGAVAVLHKPFQGPALLAAVRGVIGA